MHYLLHVTIHDALHVTCDDALHVTFDDFVAHNYKARENQRNQFCERRTFKPGNYLTNQTVKCSPNKHRVQLKTGQLKYLTNTKL